MTSELTLYTFRLCPYAHRVRLALAEKGLAAEMIEVDLKNKPQDFLARSPMGRVPVLVHGATRIWESAVILEYLDEAFPANPLMPQSAADRARARLWIDFASNRLLSTTHRMIFERSEAERRRLAEQLEQDVMVLERAMADRPGPEGTYLMGEQFTLADIALYPWFEQAGTLQRFSAFRMPDGCDGVRRWSAEVAARPAVKQCSRSGSWYEAEYRSYFAAPMS